MNKLFWFILLQVYIVVCQDISIGNSRVWIDQSVNTPLVANSVITVKFHGDNLGQHNYCQIDILEADDYNILLSRYHAYCPVSFGRFHFPDFGPIPVDAIVELYYQDDYTGQLNLIARNTTRYKTRMESVDSIAVRQFLRSAHVRTYDYYATYYPPDNVSIWVAGGETILDSDAHVALFYEGLQEYQEILIVFNTDNGRPLCISAFGYSGYVHFRKIGTISQTTANLKIILFSPSTKEPLFIITDSTYYTLMPDTIDWNRETLLRTVRQNEIRMLKKKKEPINFKYADPGRFNDIQIYKNFYSDDNTILQ